MLSQPRSLTAIMLAFLFGFASIKAEEIPDGIMPKRRQVVGTGVTTSSTTAPTTSDTPTTSKTTSNKTPTTSDTPTPSTSIPITTSNADGTTSTTNVQSNSLTSDIGTGTGTGTSTGTEKGTGTGTATSSDSAVQTKAGGTVKVGSKTIDAGTLSQKTTVRAPLVTKVTKHAQVTSTWTSDGQVYSSVYSTKDVYESTTGYATATIAPSLAHQGGDGSNLSTNSKKVIGGVVGGIGGAILIGGLAFVAWRLWGKKKQEEEAQHDNLHYSSDSLSQAKRYSQNTLMTEPYNNPNGAVNTASNF